MDKNKLSLMLNRSVPGAVLEVQKFGRSLDWVVWVEAQAIQKVAECLLHESSCRFDWLENLSVAELENIFVVSYFLSSRVWPHHLVLRLSVVVPPILEKVSLQSVVALWPMAYPMEQEIKELFGIDFQRQETEKLQELRLLQEGLQGFPLRKNAVIEKAAYVERASKDFTSRRAIVYSHLGNQSAGNQLDKRLRNFF